MTIAQLYTEHASILTVVVCKNKTMRYKKLSPELSTIVGKLIRGPQGLKGRQSAKYILYIVFLAYGGNTHRLGMKMGNQKR